MFRKPKSDIISGFFQQNDQLFFSKNYTESGFVFAPFNDEDDAVLIPENESEFLQEKVNLNKWCLRATLRAWILAHIMQRDPHNFGLRRRLLVRIFGPVIS